MGGLVRQARTGTRTEGGGGYARRPTQKRSKPVPGASAPIKRNANEGKKPAREKGLKIIAEKREVKGGVYGIVRSGKYYIR